MDELEPVLLGTKSWTYGGFDFHAYKLIDDVVLEDFPPECFSDEEINDFKSGKWIFAQVTVVCSLLGIRLGYSYTEGVPEGVSNSIGEIEDAFEVIEIFEMEQEARTEAMLVISKMDRGIIAN